LQRQAESGDDAAVPRTILAPRIAVWMLIQLSALALSMARLPLAARFPLETERLAVHELLVVQFLFSAMLFPWLLETVAEALAVVFTSIPMLALAALAGGVSTSRLAPASAFFVLWIIALTGWRAALRTGVRPMIGVACAMLLIGGSAALKYLAIEFGEARIADVAGHSPLLCSLAAVTDAELSWSQIVSAVLLSASGWVATTAQSKHK
jgi:hypothetical protein